MSGGDVLVVLQARMGSARLPGKSLMTIAGQSLVAHCVTRLRQANAGAVVVATSTRLEDEAIAAEGKAHGALVFRGHSEDVLDRVDRAAALFRPAFVVRATGDNPAVDPDSIVRLLAVMRGGAVDHAVEDGLPCGVTVEMMTVDALHQAAEHATSPHDREHVTPYIRSSGNGFRCTVVPAPAGLCRPDLRFTVDTGPDLEYMRRVFNRSDRTESRPASVSQLIAAADALAREGREVA